MNAVSRVFPALGTAALVAAALIVASPRSQAQAPPDYDLIIRNGTVVDGTGQPGRVAAVGLRGGRIAGIGALTGATARDTIDARGLVVAPGFIDVHTHEIGRAHV